MTMILDEAIESASEYRRLKQQHRQGADNGEGWKKKHELLVPDRPKACPDCQAEDCFWSKGYYFRWFVEGDIEEVIPVPRFICRWCHLVVSVLFAFLVAYRQFTKKTIVEAVERYLVVDTDYRETAGLLAGSGDDIQRPNHSQVFRWVELIAGRAAWKLNLQLQRRCVKAGKTKGLSGVHDHVCPNASRAQSLGKFRDLNSGIRLVVLTRLMLDLEADFVAALQSYFVAFVNPPLSILTGRCVRLITPQSSHHVLC